MLNSRIFSGFDSFTKSLVLVVLFFIATPIVIFSSLISLISLPQTEGLKTDYNKNDGSVLSYTDTKPVHVLSALPTYDLDTTVSVDPSDARPELIRLYLEFYRSPLAYLSHYIVQVSDNYGLDYRLLAAIAQQESNLCKTIPEDSYNCWGWGIHSKGILKFATFEEAIETVAKGLKEEYLDKGYRNPEEIMSKYTPMSQGSWAFGVSHFMEEMENPKVLN